MRKLLSSLLNKCIEDKIKPWPARENQIGEIANTRPESSREVEAFVERENPDGSIRIRVRPVDPLPGSTRHPLPPSSDDTP